MRAGSLRHTVAIQTEVSTPDGMGGSTLTWQNVDGMGSVPAGIWPLSSKERLDAMKLELEITNKIRIRYRPDITTKNRVILVAKSKIYNLISQINYDEKDLTVDFLATEDMSRVASLYYNFPWTGYEDAWAYYTSAWK